LNDISDTLLERIISDKTYMIRTLLAGQNIRSSTVNVIMITMNDFGVNTAVVYARGMKHS